MPKIFYVYITTNLINRKQYVGDRSCACDPKKDSYLGSGKYFKHAENNYGKENFKKEILEQFNTKKDAFDAQEKYIKKYNTLTPNGYNISPKGGHQCKNGASTESRKLMSIAKQGNSYKKGKKLSYISKQKISNSRIGSKNWNYNKPHGKQWNSKISNSLKQKIIQLDSYENIIKIWDSAKEAGTQLKIANSNICKVLKNNRKTAGGFKWKYEI